MDENQFPRLDKTAFFVYSSFEEADKADDEYWLSKTPQERLEYMEVLRKMNLWVFGGRPKDITDFKKLQQKKSDR